jgi:hypothetical protein
VAPKPNEYPLNIKIKIKIARRNATHEIDWAPEITSIANIRTWQRVPG